MGEARRRAATREERAQLSIVRAVIEKERIRAEARAWWEGLTEEGKAAQRAAWREKDKRRADARMQMAMMMGIAAGGGVR